MLLAVHFDHLRSAGGPAAVMWGAETFSAIRRKAARFDQCFFTLFLRPPLYGEKQPVLTTPSLKYGHGRGRNFYAFPQNLFSCLTEKWVVF